MPYSGDAPAPSPPDPLRPTVEEAMAFDAAQGKHYLGAGLRAAYALALPRLIPFLVAAMTFTDTAGERWVQIHAPRGGGHNYCVLGDEELIHALLAAAARLVGER